MIKKKESRTEVASVGREGRCQPQEGEREFFGGDDLLS